MQQWRGGLGALATNFCSHVCAKKTSAGWVYRASEKSGIKLSMNRFLPTNIRNHSNKCKIQGCLWFQMFAPVFNMPNQNLSPTYCLVNLSASDPQAPDSQGNHTDSQAAHVYIKIRPLIPTLNFNISLSHLLHIRTNSMRSLIGVEVYGFSVCSLRESPPCVRLEEGFLPS